MRYCLLVVLALSLAAPTWAGDPSTEMLNALEALRMRVVADKEPAYAAARAATEADDPEALAAADARLALVAAAENQAQWLLRELTASCAARAARVAAGNAIRRQQLQDTLATFDAEATQRKAALQAELGALP